MWITYFMQSQLSNNGLNAIWLIGNLIQCRLSSWYRLRAFERMPLSTSRWQNLVHTPRSGKATRDLYDCMTISQPMLIHRQETLWCPIMWPCSSYSSCICNNVLLLVVLVIMYTCFSCFVSQFFLYPLNHFTRLAHFVEVFIMHF